MTTEEKIEEIGTYRPINFISESDLCAYQQGLERGAREMAKWKDSEFEKRVTLALCIDCCEYESCEKCHKYNLKKELLGL